MDEKLRAFQIIESLRKGIPPQRGVSEYSVGNERLINDIRKQHLRGISEQGIIRFVSGAWGSGKTHFFRLLREVAFEEECLVSNVELNVNDAALNKFESIFSAIISHIETPTRFKAGLEEEAAPFGQVLRESLVYLAKESRSVQGEVSHEEFSRARDALWADRSIDIDFKKIVVKYWETFLPDGAEASLREQTREELLQWFAGEGTVGTYRKRFDVKKIVKREHAKLLLQSLAGFVRLSGYRGLVILFDEAEQTYSVMRKSALRDAQNNLLSLINNIAKLSGLFLIYATTPDFYINPKHGIIAYGALFQRIGKPRNKPPRSLDIIWNLDEVVLEMAHYQSAASKIRRIYESAFPESSGALPSEDNTQAFAQTLYERHPKLAAVRFWRVLVTVLVEHLDDHQQGDIRPVEQLYDDVMDRLREE